ncbi:hypothetical protein OEZ85_003753 [Tetradesmus obliquus]|uniref:Protein FAM221A n=1 Tax=Tetradesmus obliquus TaxID=3088 RepID=A0ABY8UCM0_TETOB|nr:hypothetical protein OEZ85_003753 [Tetradesmus obliquus]
MCGHRLKEHTEGHKCSNRSCSCPKFSFIVAEGSWILRCRCKHKHTEHDPSSHACSKASCSCSGFSSPWVCNCDHPWTQHQQVLVERQVLRLKRVCQGVWAQAQVPACGHFQLVGCGASNCIPVLFKDCHLLWPNHSNSYRTSSVLSFKRRAQWAAAASSARQLALQCLPHML